MQRAIPMNKNKAALEDYFAAADVAIDGDHPWDIQVADERFYDRVLGDGTLGLGESYMLGWWDCADMEELATRFVRARRAQSFRLNWKLAWHRMRAKLFNQQRRARAEEVATAHYNLSNDFYRHILGETMAYTCGYWKDTEELDAAQRAKYDLVCRKLDLQPTDRVLEHGCGWGGFARHAAAHYGCQVTAVSISEPQVAYAKELCRDLPVTAYYCDYRDQEVYNPDGQKFDKVVSIGMAEHVGPKSYPTWLEIVERQLEDGGLFLLHTIGSNVSVVANEPFTQKYIFPNCVVPSMRQLTSAAEGLLCLEDFHNFWKHYYFTMREWQRNFARQWPEIRQLDAKFDDRFYRMWNFYNFGGMGLVKNRSLELWQLVFSKRAPEVYATVR